MLQYRANMTGPGLVDKKTGEATRKSTATLKKPSDMTTSTGPGSISHMSKSRLSTPRDQETHTKMERHSQTCMDSGAGKYGIRRRVPCSRGAYHGAHSQVTTAW